MSNVLITWSEDLSVGITSIDEQHKKLVNMINALNDAMTKGQARDVLKKIFDGLLVYADKHFGYEEKLFATHAYASEAAHRKEHDALRARVTDLKKRMDEGDYMLGAEVMAFLKQWLTSHILKSDKAYTSFLQGKGVR